jgi:chromosome segregation ATPase
MNAEQPANRSEPSNVQAHARIRKPEGDIEAHSERADQAERELQAAKADIAVKDEYIASLEEELDAKSARIDSFPQVRLKVWLAGLRRGSAR